MLANVIVLNVPYAVQVFFSRLPEDKVQEFKTLLRDVSQWPVGYGDSKLDDLAKLYIAASPQTKINESADGVIDLATIAHNARVALDTIRNAYHIHGYAEAHFGSNKMTIMRGLTHMELLMVINDLHSPYPEYTETVPEHSPLGEYLKSQLGSPSMTERGKLDWLTDWFNSYNFSTEWSRYCPLPSRFTAWLHFAFKVRNHCVVATSYSDTSLSLALKPIIGAGEDNDNKNTTNPPTL